MKNKKEIAEGTSEPIKLTGMPYTLEYRPEPETPLNKERVFGYWNQLDLEIVIDNTLAEARQKETLLHELIEFVNGEFDLGLSHTKIQTLGLTLYSVFADNPTIREKLLKGYEK